MNKDPLTEWERDAAEQTARTAWLNAKAFVGNAVALGALAWTVGGLIAVFTR